jgi:N-acetylmuramoyl-L-alanine amidase
VIRQIRVAALVGVLATAPLVAPSPATASGTTSRHLQQGVDAASSYVHAYGMRAGVAVLDLRDGQIWSAGSDRHLFPSASVVKTLIATRLLITGQMHGTVARKAWTMITRSDNDAAWALYPKVGRDHLLPWIEAHYHLTGLGAKPTMPGVWGSTQLTARGMVRFYRAVHDDPTVWPWLLRAMHAYAKTSSDGEPNAFGVAAVLPKAAVKNGWDVNRDVKHPSNAIINTTGIVRSDHYAVTILAEGAHDLYYAPGERIVTSAALRVVRGISGGAIPAVPTMRTVVLDPGHNGGNSTHLSQINRLVYSGYGRHKPCNTTGTATNAGYPEHAFSWDVVNRVRRILLGRHVRVIMTRTSDTGVGPCVNRRAAIESTRGVSAAIAVHADGAAGGDHGFHLCVDSRRPEHATAATVARTRRLNSALHHSLAASSGLSVANYVGSNGYYYRDDLAGLNLSTKPTAFLELGNMRNAGDAHRQSTAAGRARIAAAIARGILAFLATLR